MYVKSKFSDSFLQFSEFTYAVFSEKLRGTQSSREENAIKEYRKNVRRFFK